jgi:AcrR family transcriptional regulator
VHPLAGASAGPPAGDPGPDPDPGARPTATGASAGPPSGATAPAAPKSKGADKAARTRAAILETALRLFRERGYEETTMRAIAAAAGVSVGNAYYYFASKEHLIQAFYDQAYVQHEEAARPILAREKDLTLRMVAVMEAWLDLMDPYREFAGAFFKNAAEPTSPLSPFSAESAPARNASIGLWRDVVEGSDTKVAKALRKELPELLWLYFMGIVLFWVHDPSGDAARTRLLARRTAPLVVRGIGLARLPVLRATIADLVALIAELKAL